MQGDWNALGEVLYRKWHVYDMGWADQIHIEDYCVCGAPYGGPLALIRDDKKLVALTGEHSKPTLRIFTASGIKLAEVEWTERKVIGMGWSDQEQLVVVYEDGDASIYDIHGNLIRNFILVAGGGVLLECHFWGNGVVGITSDMRLYVYEGLMNLEGETGSRKYTLTSGLSKDKLYTSMAIVPPLLSRSGLLEVLLGTPDHSIIVVDENDTEDQLLQDRIAAPITKISVAPNGKFLACFRKDGYLTVLSITFTTKVLDFDTKSLTRPMEVTWCGDDAVVLLWKNTGIVMVGPYGDWLNYPYEGTVLVISESDCCRIITSTSYEILQRVPPSTESIRRIGSTDPAALLYDAMEGYLEGDPKSDDNIRSIAMTNQLQYAIKSCVTAASYEYDISKQQSYYRAASYGKAFCSNYSSDTSVGPGISADDCDFVEISKKLRILNDIRRPEIGIPLTIQEYNRLTPEILVNRLTLRNHHFLALKICELLNISTESVLIHWASEKVKKLASTTSLSDEEITSLITYKLRPYSHSTSGSRTHSLSFLNIAAAAYHMGRRKLATMLLELESNPSDQVPLLLSMNEEELALQKAIASDDTDLIYLTLIHLERSQPDRETFYRLISNYPEAINLLKIYYRNKMVNDAPPVAINTGSIVAPSVSSNNTPSGKGGDPHALLHSLLLFQRNYFEAAVLAVNQANINANNNPKKVQYLREAVSLFGQNKDLAVYKSFTEEEIELMEIQQALGLRTGKDFMNQNLSETLESIYLLSIEFENEAQRWNSEAQKLIKKFRLSDKMVWHIRIKCYSQTGQWDLLMKLANEKKSPVGYKPFIKACSKCGQSESEIEKYIERISSPEEKYDVYVELAMWRKAADVALKLKDFHRLQQIIRCCRDPQLERQIQEMIARI